ncbi:MAG: hypothetical protein DRR06_02965 [Gammaproteobacteria bacterium]|nr:MAG: hypothetical protein DRR06_02965 [Gammaproteobacteria bacterium]
MRLESTDKAACSQAHDSDHLVLAVINNQTQGSVVLDHRGDVVIWNNWMADWTGIAGTQAVGRNVEVLAPAITGNEYARAIKSAIELGKSVTWSLEMDPQRLDAIEAAMTRGDRLLPLTRISVVPLPVEGQQGCLLEFIEAPFNPVQLRDVAATAKSADKHVHKEAENNRFPVYLESSEVAVLSVDTSGIIREVNERLLIQTGYSYQQLIDTPVRLLFPTLSDSYDVDDYRALLASKIKQSSEGVIEAATVSGETRAFKISLFPSVSRQDLFVVLCEDVSGQSGAEDTILRQRELLATVYNQVADGIALLDGNGLIEQINPVGLAMLGKRSGQGQQMPVETIINMNDSEGRDINPCREALNRGSPCSTPESTFLLVEGKEPTHITGIATPLRDRHNQINGCVLVFRTVEESRRVSNRLSWQADHDPVTQLPNRRFLEDQLVRAIEATHTSDQVHVLLYIDLHNFSLVNDTGGRTAGDTLLRECGRLLQQVVGADHVVARIGNDEFAVLLLNCPPEEARDIAEEILAQIKSFSFPWQERRLKIGANIGAEVIDRETGSEIDVLVAAASSCANAKESGRNRLFFRQHQDERQVSGRMSQWVPKISEALEQDRFCVYYQPIVPLGNYAKEYDHYEALIRMIDESGQLVAPGKFIPAAELYGLIDDIDRWTVQHVISELGTEKWRKKSNLRISINLSGVTISNEGFKDYLLDLMDKSTVNPHQLQFEITETAAIREFDRALDLIHVLKAKGFYFSLDDFGSGLSSFGYLKDLPVDFLKIDGSFIRNMELNDVDFSMVSTINHLAHIMGIATIAECVENQTQLTMLEQMGVDYAQGFFIDVPQPMKNFMG